MALCLKIFVRPYSIIVPNFKFLSQSARFPQILTDSSPANIEHITRESRYSPIALLAEKSTAPMDLFDLLQTDQTLNDNVNMNHLPLHVAIQRCHFETALHLIQLGARVDIRVGCCPVPIYDFMSGRYYQERHFQSELFTQCEMECEMALQQVCRTPVV